MHPDITPASALSLERSPVRGYVSAAVRQLHPPKKRQGRQSAINTRVRKGEHHPCVTLDRILVEERAAGTTLDRALGVARALRAATLVLWGAVPAVDDPAAVSAAHLAETIAQCEADPLQARVFCDLGRASDADLELLECKLDVHLTRVEALCLALSAEAARRQQAREAAAREREQLRAAHAATTRWLAARPALAGAPC